MSKSSLRVIVFSFHRSSCRSKDIRLWFISFRSRSSLIHGLEGSDEMTSRGISDYVNIEWTVQDELKGHELVVMSEL
ncbi:hypothetical protein Bca4012_002951 [Brassica carinata]